MVVSSFQLINKKWEESWIYISLAKYLGAQFYFFFLKGDGPTKHRKLVFRCWSPTNQPKKVDLLPFKLFACSLASVVQILQIPT
jgi:hypothetical protein